jgi:RNA-directed DNA polymerase
VPEMATTTKQDRVRELQRALYRAAKADPERRFHALYDKVHRRDVLERAWESVRANRGAAGIDRTTLADVERYGIGRLLDELAMDLRDGRWRPLPARRVFIPKPGREELRPLSIPAVRDRIVQAAVKGGDRADLRGRLPRVLVWVSPQALGARCPPGLDR